MTKNLKKKERKNKNKLIFTDKFKDYFEFLTKINDKSEWMWNFYYKYVVCVFIINVFTMATISVVIGYLLNGDFDATHAYHLFVFM